MAARCDLRNNQEPTQRENLLARHYLFVTDLERSNNELRAALILAGKEIRKLNFGKSDTPLLQKLREVLRSSQQPLHALRGGESQSQHRWNPSLAI